MRKSHVLLLALVGVLAFARVSQAQPVTGTGVVLTVTDTGINGENLADTPVSDVIDMFGSGKATNQLGLTWKITPGTSATVTVGCSQSPDNVATTFSPVPLCDTNSPSTCVPDVRSMTLASWATVSGVKPIETNWHITKRYVKCYIDDAANGTGTVVVTGNRSWQ